ncbi:MAG: hypothetical protein RIT27_2476 [Pseudomonadota bacterium]
MRGEIKMDMTIKIPDDVYQQLRGITNLEVVITNFLKQSSLNKLPLSSNTSRQLIQQIKEFHVSQPVTRFDIKMLIEEGRE